MRRFVSPEEICEHFFETRKNLYILRKKFIEGMFRAEIQCLSEQARFIDLILEKKIILSKNADIVVQQTKEHNFLLDPVKKWKKSGKFECIETNVQNSRNNQTEQSKS